MLHPAPRCRRRRRSTRTYVRARTAAIYRNRVLCVVSPAPRVVVVVVVVVVRRRRLVVVVVVTNKNLRYYCANAIPCCKDRS